MEIYTDIILVWFTIGTILGLGALLFGDYPVLYAIAVAVCWPFLVIARGLRMILVSLTSD